MHFIFLFCPLGFISFLVALAPAADRFTTVDFGCQAERLLGSRLAALAADLVLPIASGHLLPAASAWVAPFILDLPFGHFPFADFLQSCVVHSVELRHTPTWASINCQAGSLTTPSAISSHHFEL